MGSCLSTAHFRMKTNTCLLPRRPWTVFWTPLPPSLSSGTRITRAAFPTRTRSSRSFRFALAPTNLLQRCASNFRAAISSIPVRSDNRVTAIRAPLLPSPTWSTRSSSFGACPSIFPSSSSACVWPTFRSLWSSGSSWADEAVRVTDPLVVSGKDSSTFTYLIDNLIVEFAAESQASLREFTASGIVEVRENGGCVAPFSGMSWEVRGDGEKPLLHLWSEQLNLTRRVLAITDHSEQRLALAVERFGRAKPDRLEFIRREFERGARELSREDFRGRLTHLLAEQFPDETLESLATSRDLEHSLSGNYARDSSAAAPHTSRCWRCPAENHRTRSTRASRSLYSGCGARAN